MRFQVPQFIEVEDKIFGPLTLKQFIYLVGGGAAIFVLFVLLPFFLFVVLAVPIGAFAAALAFYKVNNMPFIRFVESAFKYFQSNKTYTWKKIEKTPKKIIKQPATSTQLQEPAALSQKKLDDLSWSLDIKSKTSDN